MSVYILNGQCVFQEHRVHLIQLSGAIVAGDIINLFWALANRRSLLRCHKAFYFWPWICAPPLLVTPLVGITKRGRTMNYFHRGSCFWYWTRAGFYSEMERWSCHQSGLSGKIPVTVVAGSVISCCARHFNSQVVFMYIIPTTKKFRVGIAIIECLYASAFPEITCAWLCKICFLKFLVALEPPRRRSSERRTWLYVGKSFQPLRFGKYGGLPAYF